MKRILFLLSLAAMPALADTLTFKVIGIDCASCAPPVKRALASVPGVKSATVDPNAKTATVDVLPGFDKAKIHEALSNAGFEAEFPGEKTADFEALPADVVKSLDIIGYDGKSNVDLDKIVARGKVTIVDFYADWCGPCRVLESRIERYMLAHPNLAVRRVNIGKWDNAGASQATHLGAAALPYIRLYDTRGHYVTSVTGGMWDEVLAAIEKAGR